MIEFSPLSDEMKKHLEKIREEQQEQTRMIMESLREANKLYDNIQ